MDGWMDGWMDGVTEINSLDIRLMYFPVSFGKKGDAKSPSTANAAMLYGNSACGPWDCMNSTGSHISYR
jgi:hypothetical protein